MIVHLHSFFLLFSNVLCLSYLTGPPSAPEGPLETSDITATTVTLSWKPPKSDGGQPLTAYIIERKDTKRLGWIIVEKIGPNITSYTVQNLTTGVDYYFRVMAENSEGVSPPLETSVTVRPIRQPGKFTVDNTHFF